jgi:hypothetical protein
MEILNRIHEQGIYSLYLDLNEPFVTTKRYKSPFREENNPSLGFYFNNGEVLWNDFGDDSLGGDAIFFVQKLFNVSYENALKKISNDFQLGLCNDAEEVVSIIREIKLKEKKPTKITVVQQNFSLDDINFWESYGCSLSSLKKYDVSAAKYVYLNRILVKMYTKKHPIFSYLIRDDDIYKIYDPFAKHDSKWLYNGTKDDIVGFKQLPEFGYKLIITKSLKDVMTLDGYHLNSIAVQSESAYFPVSKLLDLNERFKRIFLLFDNDEPGKKSSALFVEKFPFVTPIFMPDGYYKDISDNYYHLGQKNVNRILNELID